MIQDPYEEEGEAKSEEADGVQDQSLQSLGHRLASTFQEYKDARKETENEWLKDLRQYNGQYEPDVLARLNESGARSKVFVGLTRTKVMAAYSRIIDLIFQHGDPAFAVHSTPVPELDPMQAMQMRQQATQEVIAASQMMDPNMNQDLIMERMKELEVELKKAEKRVAEKAAESMTIDILDQMIEANAEMKLKESILEACIFGSGAVKGGTVRIDKKQSYTKVMDPETGQMVHALAIIETPAPEIETVSIFDLYPDPYCTTLDDCDGLFRRHVLTRRQFRELADLPNFDSAVIKHILKMNRSGNHTEEDHERTRRRIAGIHDHSESGRFSVLEYWGTVDGYELGEHGIEIEEDDLSKDYSACVWMCDSKVIKVMLNPISGYTMPYFIFPYERSPHQFWGTGVPRMMRDSQGTMNAAIRIWLDNMALSSGPMIEVNTDLLAAGEDPTDIHPWRVFLRQGGDGSMPAVRWYQPVANANGLNQIVEIFRRFADETTSLPSYTHGEQGQGLNRTATGMSMLMGAANVALKSTIKNIDDFLMEPLVTALFHWNMEFGTNEGSKGDLKVVARGSTALVQKEVQSQRLLQFLSLVSNDLDTPVIDRKQLLRDIATSMDINPEKILKSEEALLLEQQQQQQQQQQLLQAQMQQAAGAGYPPPQGGGGMDPNQGPPQMPF